MPREETTTSLSSRRKRLSLPGWSAKSGFWRQETRNSPVDASETKEALGGFLLLEARDLNHAIALMSKHPGGEDNDIRDPAG